MLSFLQQRLGKSPTKSQSNMTRQYSIESAFARVNARNVCKDVSTTPSLTTAASMTDTSSEATDSSSKPEFNKQSSARSKVSSDIYNENPISRQHVRSPRKHNVNGESHTTWAETKVSPGKNDSRERLLQQSVQALDEGWDIGAMPGDDLKLHPKEDPVSKRRKSTRLDILDKASSVVEKTSSVLGKRGRETMEAGMEKFQALKGESKRSSMKPREPETPSFGNPRKRARFWTASLKREKSPEPDDKRKPVKKRSKHWLTQGLYVGQYPDFDPRLTETKNKLKKASTKPQDNQKPPAMPLPMFAGERTLTLGRDFKLPFDVFSPLPPGQPKPDEWKKTHKNVFVGDAAELWKKAKPLEHSTCICTEETGCDEHCFNRFMLYECDDLNCNVGSEHCTNRSFADLKKRCKKGGKYNIGVEVMKTIDRGYGVRANRTFESNQIIVEYTGEIITQEECDDRMHNRYKDAECYYLMDFDQSMVLDATRGSIARFINHSCAPNCRMIKWTVSGKPRMALFASDEGIMTGEELTYDYNFDPFSAKNVQECRCGAQGCRGVLGPKPKEIKEALKPIANSGKRKIQQVVEVAVETVSKKRKIAVPSSVKSVFATAKAQTSRRLSQAGMLGSSSTKPKRPVKKASEGSLKALKRGSAMETLGDEKKKQQLTKDESRRRSTGDLLPKMPKGWAYVETPPRSPTGGKAEPPAEEAGSRWDAVKTEDGRARENVVRTVRRRGRGTPGKSIRVIALGDDELKGWR